MDKWKRFGLKMLFPPLWLTLILTVFSIISLLMVFMKGMENSIFAYVCYVISFYTLTVVCMWLWKILPGYVRNAKEIIHKNKYADKYL